MALGSVNLARVLYTASVEMIENQGLFKMPDSPHSKQPEPPGFAGHPEVEYRCKFEESGTSFRRETPGRVRPTILSDIGEMPNKVAPGRRVLRLLRPLPVTVSSWHASTPARRSRCQPSRIVSFP